MLLYFDRGLISGLLPKIKLRWGSLTGVQEGLISSAFTVSFIVFCPLFAHLANASKISVSWIMSFGFLFWGTSAILCSVFSLVSIGRRQIWGYWCFVASRTMVGIGESAFIALSVSIVDDIASDENRGSYQSVLLGGIPIGTALGYSVAGIVVELLPWQYAFLVEGIIGLIVSVAFLLIPLDEARVKAKQQKLKQRQSGKPVDEATEFLSGRTRKVGLFSAILQLIKNPTYMSLVLGKSQYIGVIGALSFWTPTWLQYRLSSTKLSEDKQLLIANFGFSAVLIIASIVGTVVGGILLDRIGKRDEAKLALMPTRGSLLITIFTTLSIPLGVVVFLWVKMHIAAVFVLFTIAIVLLMCCQSPFQIAILSSCDEDLRDFAISFQILFLRLLGDLPSPTLFGWLADLTGSLDLANLIIYALLVPCAICYLLATLFAYRKYRMGQETAVMAQTEFKDLLERTGQ
jgi:MFS family permease